MNTVENSERIRFKYTWTPLSSPYTWSLYTAVHCNKDLGAQKGTITEFH